MKREREIMVALPEQFKEIEDAGIHVMLAVGVDPEGGTKIKRINGTQWNQELLDRAREAVELVHEEMMGDEEELSFSVEKQRKKNQWWPNSIECPCGHVLRFRDEPASYIVDCPKCGGCVVVQPV